MPKGAAAVPIRLPPGRRPPARPTIRRVWNDLKLVEEPSPPGESAAAAVLIALYETGDGRTRLVLTKRPDTMPTHAGHISFPGGRPDADDQGPLATALREAHEEVGIPPETVDLMGYLPAIHTVEYRLMVVPVVGRLPSPPHLIPSPREVVKIYQPSLEELAEERLWRSEDWNGHRVWFYELEGDVLWGATAMMVRRLLNLDTY